MAPRVSFALTATLVPISLSFSTLLLPSPTRAAGDDGLITQFCLASFNAAMAHAGKTPPAGMGQFTCSCFLDEVKSGFSIDAAQNSCKEKAASRYEL